MSKKKPTVLMILDGYGLNDKVEGNAVKQANTPVMDRSDGKLPIRRGTGKRNGSRSSRRPDG